MHHAHSPQLCRVVSVCAVNVTLIQHFVHNTEDSNLRRPRILQLLQKCIFLNKFDVGELRTTVSLSEWFQGKTGFQEETGEWSTLWCLQTSQFNCKHRKKVQINVSPTTGSIFGWPWWQRMLTVLLALYVAKNCSHVFDSVISGSIIHHTMLH